MIPDAIILDRSFLELSVRAGIVEYWVIDLSGRRLVIHRVPEDGACRCVLAYREGERVACRAAPGAEVRVGDLLSVRNGPGSN